MIDWSLAFSVAAGILVAGGVLCVLAFAVFALWLFFKGLFYR